MFGKSDKARGPEGDKPNRRHILKWAATASLGSVIASKSTPASGAPMARRGSTNRSSSHKQLAQADYHSSFQAFGGRLSDDLNTLRETTSRPPHEQFAVAVIGSGYGAAICAARLAARLGSGQRLCILERGREWISGTFPDSFRAATAATRQALMGRDKGKVENPLGLYNIQMNAEINTLSASALGGTSLINANVVLKPDEDVFRQNCWPIALRERAALDPYFERAARMLGLARTPWDQTKKVVSRRDAAERLNPRPGFFDLPPLTVTYDDRYLDAESRNPQGVYQRPCILCGDCITGCNVGAKNTLVTNYLPLAKQNGAEIYTQVEILSIRAAEGYFELSAVIRDDSMGGMHEERITIASPIVIVAAGSPGSAEILLQSRACGLELSPAIGERWSFNGDTIGFVVDPRCRAPIGGVGADSCDMASIGPTVQTSLIYNRRPELQHRMLIQEAAVPSLTTRIFSLLLQDPDLDRSMIMLGMGHDGARGKVIWKDDRWQVEWPDLRDSQYRKMVFNDFNALAQAHGGWYKRLRLFGDTLVSVHPLGGCGMSDDPLQGVVNDRGQVFAPQGGVPGDSPDGPPVYPGLYVADGSVMPTSLGVNPLMTICAVAERIAEQIAQEPRWAYLFHGRTFRG